MTAELNHGVDNPVPRGRNPFVQRRGFFCPICWTKVTEAPGDEIAELVVCASVLKLVLLTSFPLTVTFESSDPGCC